MSEMSKALEKLTIARIAMLLKQPFFGTLAMKLNLIEVDKVTAEKMTTAAVDGRNLWYNPPFIESLDKDETSFLVAHEVLHCFPAGTIIPGDFKSIEEISSGDRVVGQNGVNSVVVAPMSKNFDGELIAIKARGMLPIKMTPEHPVLVQKDLGWKEVEPDSQTGKRKTVRQWSDPEWVNAGDLVEGDWVQIPRIKGDVDNYTIECKFHKNIWSSPMKIRNGVALDSKVSEFLGWYVAEGSTSVCKNGHNYSVITLHKNEMNVALSLKETLYEKFGISSNIIEDKNNICRLRFSSRPFGRWLIKNCGDGAKNKRIPKAILYNTDLNILQSFIRAYIKGDGNVNEKSVSFGTTSKVLALQMQMAFARVGVLINLSEEGPINCIIRGKTISRGILYKANTSFGKAFNIMEEESTAVRPTQYFGITDDAILTPIRNITRESYSGLVYNMETTCHTYTSGNIVTHNCVFSHIYRRFDRDPKIWNMAADYVINSTLIEAGFKMPKIGLYEKKYLNWTSEDVYDDLIENNTSPKPTLDVHAGDPGYPGQDKDGEGGEGQSEEERQKLEDEWKDAVIQAAQSAAGNVPAGIQRLIRDITEPKMDWRQILQMHLQSCVRTDYTWMRPNKRTFGMGITMPSMDMDDMVKVAIAIDTSGSISQEMLKDFLGEVKGIMDSFSGYEIHISCFDTEIYSYRCFTNEDDLMSYEPKGGGGTDFMVWWRWVQEQDWIGDVRKILFFTDGFPFGDWGIEGVCDTLWVVHGSSNEAPFGTTIFYDDHKKGKN